jgi:type I restriction enzyme S subunit
MAFPRYSSYKNSDIDWVGDIPAHWEVERAKWLFKRVERSVRSDDDIVTAFRDGTVTLRSNRRTEGFTTALQEHGYQGIRKGDLVIHAMDAFAGAIGVSDSDGKATPVYAACVNRGEYYTNNHYYSYLLRYMSKVGYIESLAKGIRERSTDFRFNDFAKLNLPIPPRDEQDRIANFLDQKTAEIGEAIAKKQRLIELLKEQKTILINQAVTKGLNPDVPMRDSGVEWIGEVPAHWKLSRIGFIGSVGNGSTPNRSVFGYWEGGDIPWLNSSKVNDGVIISADQFVTKKAIRECHLPTIRPDSIVIGITGEGKTRGMAALCDIEATINQHLSFIEVRDKRILPRYLLSYLQGMYDWLRHESSANGSTKGAITCGDIKKYKLPIPPLKEQQEIIHHIETRDQDLNDLIEKATVTINRLSELRNIVVSQAVTGKTKI